MADRDATVRDVADAVGLAEGEAGVEAVLATLARLGPVSTRALSRAVDLPVPIVASVCGELRKRGVVAEERPARLTEAGRTWYGRSRLALPSPTCPTCRGRGLTIADELDPVVRELARYAATAPGTRVELDQCQCTVETKLRRVLALHAAGALAGRRILVLGDDDLISLAIAAVVRRLGSRRSVARLTVVDVDPDVVRFVKRRLRTAPFATSCVVHDVREPLSPALGVYDTVVTDPPYTAAGARLFLSRAVEALALPGGDVFFSFGSRTTSTTQLVQRTILELGLVVRSLTRDFNAYMGAGVLGGTSHLYHLSATPETRPPADPLYPGPLYTGETVTRSAPPGKRGAARRTAPRARAPRKRA